MKRLVLVSLSIFFVLSFLEDFARPVFAPLFCGTAELMFSVIGFVDGIDFQPNLDPSTKSWDTNVVIHNKNEVFGIQCDSTLGFTALAVFLALWAGTPLQGRRLTALWHGLVFLCLFLFARLGLMILQGVASHECVAPGSHWPLIRTPKFCALVTFLNWELAMDLVVALFGPFVIWALVCGRRLLLPPAFQIVDHPVGKAAPDSAVGEPTYSSPLAGFDPFSTGQLLVLPDPSSSDREPDRQGH